MEEHSINKRIYQYSWISLFLITVNANSSAIEIQAPNKENNAHIIKEATSKPNTELNTRETSLLGYPLTRSLSEIFISEGKSYIAKNNEKALSMFLSALIVAKKDSNEVIRAKLWIAKMQFLVKNYMEAENLFRDMLRNKLTPIDEEAALEGLIRTKNSAGDANTAIEIIPLNYDFKTPDLVLALAEAYANLGKEPHASYLLEKQSQLLESIPNSSDLKKELDTLKQKISMHLKEENKKKYTEYIKEAHYAEDARDFKSALQYYETALKLFKDDFSFSIEARMGMAKMNYALRKYADSKKIYTELLKENLNKIERTIVQEFLKLINTHSSNVQVSKKSKKLESHISPEDIFKKCIDPCLLKNVEEQVAQKDYKNAVILLDQAAKEEPCNIYLLLKEIDLYKTSEQYKNALHTLNITDWRFPDNLETLESRNEIEEKLCELPHNRASIYHDWQYVSDLQQYWHFTTYSYYRIENYAQYGIAYNSAARFGLKGNQTEFDLSINPWRGLRGDFSLAYASKNQLLWPNRLYYGEIYYAFLNGLEFSLGQEKRKYITFDNQKIIRTTVSIGQYFDKYLLLCRLNKYNFKHLFLGRISLTRFFGDNDFIAFEIIGGKSPDIADLPPLDQMVLLEQKGYSLSGQLEVCPNFLVRVGIGFYSQYYPFSNLHRKVTDSYINVAWKF